MATDTPGAAVEQVLADAGFDVSPGRPGETEELAAAEAAAQAQVVAASWSVAEAAHHLRTTSAEIRRLIAERRLFGFQDQNRWRIPDFQFDERGLLPGIAQLVEALDPALGPVSVQRFATQPNEELLVGDRPLSPVEWLAPQQDPAVVAPIAAGLVVG